ncbi:acetyl-CoA carboxylase carboxyl transferase subunit alpha [Nocardia acidivorans]|uniref:acetyl-CoA carboxylase carboxyl transferase subunit alpha n=1 Tax=Nocardia acidivorans TaxID=404580 RepID=UPI00083240E7|nr:acetyl-CoA carboxylase carboxyl transferase subunit alpha [Nocardia acidivorans]
MTSAVAESEWLKCEGCRGLIYRNRYRRLGRTCPECGWHGPLTPDERLALLLDPGSEHEALPADTVVDPLGFVDRKPYRARLTEAHHRVGADAVRVVRGRIGGRAVVAAVMDFRFLGGSLGVAAGEAITTACELARAERIPLLLITASGGARMQEGALALMQMAKTSNAMAELDAAGVLTLTLVTDPTYGGVAASFASLSDVIIAEPGARMGFAGPRVIEQTVRQVLPEGFQTADFLLRSGLADDVRSRAELPQALRVLLAVQDRPESDWGAGESDAVIRDPQLIDPIAAVEQVRLARHRDRPTTLEHLAAWTDGFVELHGDRMGADCPSIVCGIAALDGLPVVVIGHQKGRETRELARRNFGMPTPAGYRKARRMMRLAGKLGLPLVTLVDTPGAYPGADAERHGQAAAIAECLRELGTLPVPVVSVITGEGGSGGALALAVADRVLLCRNAVYSVISPEGCAAILWRDRGRVAEAADALRLDARTLLELGVVDGIVPEPEGGAHLNPEAASGAVRAAIVCALRELRGTAAAELVRTRQERFRRYGVVR